MRNTSIILYQFCQILLKTLYDGSPKISNFQATLNAIISHINLCMYNNLVVLRTYFPYVWYILLYSWVDFNLSLKNMLLSPAWYGKPYWKYLKKSSFTRANFLCHRTFTVENCLVMLRSHEEIYLLQKNVT